MRVLQINTVYASGSTGKIAAEIHDLCRKDGIECTTAYRYAGETAYADTVPISTWFDCHMHNRLFRYTMLQGFFSYFRTKRFLKWVRAYDPDVIHLHNIHGSYIHHRLLFDYLKKSRAKVVWTLHDCWALTGFCPYYDMVGCDKWKSTCRACPQKGRSLDLSAYVHKKKKQWFSGVPAMTLVANSRWTLEQLRASYLRDYPATVIYNGIDTTLFQPTEGDFRAQHGCEDKYLVLGVAFGWGKRKGLDAFVALSEKLPERYRIVLVGTNEEIDRTLPARILSIHRTADQAELAKLYTAADVFVNPTREEAFGLVNIEALACGTPGVTFRTGGSPECYDGSCGAVVEKDDIDGLAAEIVRICETRPYRREDCVAFAQRFRKEERYHEYIDLYKRICHGDE